jgi:DNA topoisomerase-1
VLQDRNYVRLESRRFVPEDRGRLVIAFLVAFFDQYVQPGFTADLEGRLDDVAAGARHWKQVLREFWDPFSGQVDEVKERRVAEVIDALNELLALHLFPPREGGADPRACPLCSDGRLSLKLGRFGAFVGCSNYPECRFTRQLGTPAVDGEEKPALEERLIGVEPESGDEIRLKRGPYGPYVQRGQGEGARRSSLAPNLSPEALDLETAQKLLALPREIGRHPESGQPIEAGINRYGPYVKHDRFVRLGRDDDVLTIGMNRAIALLEDAGGKTRSAPKVLKDLGPHPKDKKPVVLYEGRFGPYLKHGKLNASLRKGHDVATLTMEQAVTLLQEKAAKGKGKTPSGARKPTSKTRTGQGNGAHKAGRRATKR